MGVLGRLDIDVLLPVGGGEVDLAGVDLDVHLHQVVRRLAVDVQRDRDRAGELAVALRRKITSTEASIVPVTF